MSNLPDDAKPGIYYVKMRESPDRWEIAHADPLTELVGYLRDLQMYPTSEVITWGSRILTPEEMEEQEAGLSSAWHTVAALRDDLTQAKALLRDVLCQWKATIQVDSAKKLQSIIQYPLTIRNAERWLEEKEGEG